VALQLTKDAPLPFAAQAQATLDPARTVPPPGWQLTLGASVEARPPAVFSVGVVPVGTGVKPPTVPDPPVLLVAGDQVQGVQPLPFSRLPVGVQGTDELPML
jgi:hypothetical protein